MQELTPETILKETGLKKTEQRIVILSKIQSFGKAFTLPDLEEVLSEMDRVTIYRTINSFYESKILYRIPGESVITHYALCSSFTTHSHPHFKCTGCGKMTCLPSVDKSVFDVPSTYKIQNLYCYVEGLCDSCNA